MVHEQAAMPMSQAKKEQLKLVKQDVKHKVKALTDFLEDEKLCVVPGPASNRQMFSGAAATAVGIQGASDVRHEWQGKVAAMLQQIFEGSVKARESDVAVAMAGVDAAEQAKVAAEKNLETLKAASEAEQVDLVSKKIATAEASDEDKKAAHALVTINKDLEELEVRTREAVQLKDDCNDVSENKFKALLESTCSSLAEANKFLKETQKIMRKSDAEKSLIVGIDSSALKTPDNRGDFDNIIMEEAKSFLASYCVQLEERVSDARNLKVKTIDEQAKAKVTLETTKANKREAAEAVIAGREKVKEGRENVAAATNDVHEKESAIPVAKKVLKEKEKDLESAKNAAAAFKFLFNRKDSLPEASPEEVLLEHLKIVDGIELDGAVIAACTEACKGGKPVTPEVAAKIFSKFSQDDHISKEERWTLRYCLSKFEWEEEAQKKITESCQKVMAAEGVTPPPAKKRKTVGGYYEKMDGVKCDRGIIEACREAVDGAGDGRVSLEDAKKVFAATIDGGQVTNYERWSLVYCLTEFVWTSAAQSWFVGEWKNLQCNEEEKV